MVRSVGGILNAEKVAPALLEHLVATGTRQLRERSHCRLPLFALPALVYRSVARVRVPQLVPVGLRSPFPLASMPAPPEPGREIEGAGERMRGRDLSPMRRGASVQRALITPLFVATVHRPP